MAPRTRRAIVLAGALAALLVAVRLSRDRAVPGTGSSAPAQAPVREASRTPGRPNGFVDLDLTVLNAPRTEPTETERNPFRFKAAPAWPSGTAPSVRSAGGGASEASASIPEALSAAGPPVPPRIPLKFIGIVDTPNVGRLAVLSDGRGVYHGREGDTIEGRYRILRIGVESVELAYIDGRGRQIIRLTGQ